MKAARLMDVMTFDIDHGYVLPPLGPLDVLVEVHRTGVCNGEVTQALGQAGLITPGKVMGHEYSGRVVERGAAVDELTGGRIEEGTFVAGQWDGGFATAMVLDARLCQPVPDHPAVVEHGGMLELTGCAVNAVEAANPQLGESVVIVGQGTLGLLIAMVAQLRSPSPLIVLARRDEPLELARSVGIRHTVNTSRPGWRERVLERTNGGADVVVEAIGQQAGIDQAASIVRPADRSPDGKPAGRIIPAGYHQVDGGVREWPEKAMNEGGIGRPSGHFGGRSTINHGILVAAQKLADGDLDFDQLEIDYFGIDDIAAAFDVAADRTRGGLRSIIDAKL